MKEQLGDGYFTTGNPGHIIHHESGHAFNYFNSTAIERAKGGVSKFSTFENLELSYGMDDNWLEAQKDYTSLPQVSGWDESIQRDVRLGVSRYGADDPLEMVAEMYSGHLDGKTYATEFENMYDIFEGWRP